MLGQEILRLRVDRSHGAGVTLLYRNASWTRRIPGNHISFLEYVFIPTTTRKMSVQSKGQSCPQRDTGCLEQTGTWVPPAVLLGWRGLWLVWRGADVAGRRAEPTENAHSPQGPRVCLLRPAEAGDECLQVSCTGPGARVPPGHFPGDCGPRDSQGAARLAPPPCRLTPWPMPSLDP